jgi:hypothetical protein
MITPSLLRYDTRRQQPQSFRLKDAANWEREYYRIAETPPAIGVTQVEIEVRSNGPSLLIAAE